MRLPGVDSVAKPISPAFPSPRILQGSKRQHQQGWGQRSTTKVHKNSLKKVIKKRKVGANKEAVQGVTSGPSSFTTPGYDSLHYSMTRQHPNTVALSWIHNRGLQMSGDGGRI